LLRLATKRSVGIGPFRSFSGEQRVSALEDKLRNQLGSIQRLLEQQQQQGPAAVVKPDVTEELLNRPTSFPRGDVKVVLLENIHEKAVEIFKEQGFSVDSIPHALKGQDLIDAAGEAHILGIRSKTKLDEDFFEQVKGGKNKLWACGCFCIGTNQVDLQAAAAQGISVFNAPFSNTRSVAEQTISEVIMLHRQMGDRSNAMHQGIWNKSAKGSREVRGKTLGVVGYGRIGSQVSIMAEAMGMKVIYYDGSKRLQLGNAQQVDSLEALLSASDCVTLHVPAIPSTRNMINGQAISMMKKGAFLINNARGSVVDIEALAEALRDGKLGGAALDVFPDEPASNQEPFESELVGLPNVVLTPHTAGSTEEAQENIGIEVALKMTRLLNDGSTTTSVNMPEVDLPDLPPVPADAVEGSSVCRILHMHHNRPGMLSKINNLTGESNMNVVSQYLQSNPSYSYMAIDVEGAGTEARQQLVQDLKAVEGTIFSRLIV